MATVLLPTASSAASPPTTPWTYPASPQPFTSESPWRTTIPAGATVDPASAAMVARATRESAGYANLVEFGIPIYEVTAEAPRSVVRCTVVSLWGPCPFNGITVPIPVGATPHVGSDGAMVVIDYSTRTVFEFWQAAHTATGWTTSFGAINDLDGTGWGGGSTASGASRLAGVVRIAEVAQGVIDHALALQTDNVCAGVFRPPALGTDGQSWRSDCIPEGARLRLDPTVDLDGLDLTPALRTVAQALQTYGAFVIDRGGAALSISFERDPTADNQSIGRNWERAGLRWDYDDLSALPWGRLQVLADPRDMWSTPQTS